MISLLQNALPFLALLVLVIPGVWLGYLIVGNSIFWKKYEKDAPLLDYAPVGNWPEVAILAILDEKDDQPWNSIRSALNQNYANKEIIVVANGVNADTLLTALEKLNGECFRVVEFKNKVSLPDIYNFVLKITQAPSLFVSHPGVILEPDVITKLSMQLYQDSRVGVVYATKSLSPAKNAREYAHALVVMLETLKKKASRIYGKLLVHDEKCALFRTNALIDIGGFNAKAPNIISFAGWAIQTLFWSARFESRAKYKLKESLSWKALLNAALEREKQDIFMLKTSSSVLFDKKQKRLIYPYLNPIFRRIFYSLQATVLILSAFFSASGTYVSITGLSLILISLLILLHKNKSSKKRVSMPFKKFHLFSFVKTLFNKEGVNKC